MARVLRNLKIREISSVDKGAGDGTRIVLFKRHEPKRAPLLFNDVIKARSRIEEFDREVERRRANPEYDGGAEARRDEDEEQTRRAADQEDDIVAERPILEPGLAQMVDAIRTAHPQTSVADAVHYLLNNSRGRQVAAHLASISKKEQPMPTTDQVLEKHASFVKAHGIVPIAKGIVEKGSSPLSEHEFSALVMTAAQREKAPHESVGKAFERLLQEPDVAKAHRIIVEGQWVAKAQSLLNPIRTVASRG